MLNEAGISYGGLFARYSRRRGRLLRTLNPFTGQAVDYSTPLKGENWLLRVMTPGVISCEVEPTTLSYMDRGNRVRAYCDTLTIFGNNFGIADLVVDDLTPQAEESFEALRKACTVYNYTPQLRTKREIRDNLILLENLIHMRQQLILHPVLPQHTKAVKEFFEYAPRAVSPRESLQWTYRKYFPATVIDSALFALHCSGHLSINIEEVPYGPKSTFTFTCTA
ncbi:MULTISPECIES: hypothetical protein [unclassified Polaromonas]|jgi:hypothetical protein|uniref:hypothetical protein n=1 Tax=unclassified Polaromonas TaxID=2638319 RepID=UPI0025EBFC23|nr:MULTISPECIES: hypothetical protein [unclassified Polaromonas]